jgi:hypothetical protein
MPKPTPPAPTATDLATAIQIARLAREINQLNASQKDRSPEEKARLADQASQRVEAQLYFYRSLTQGKAAWKFDHDEKTVVRGLIDTEVARLNGYLPWPEGDHPPILSPEEEPLAARVAELTALSAAI